MQNQKPTEKIVIIDFDGTLCGFEFPNVGPPEPHVREALETLKDAGYIIKIHSCRTATYWARPLEREQHIDVILKFMYDHRLPYDELILDVDKPLADLYIDDRGLRYDNNWLEITERLKENG